MEVISRETIKPSTPTPPHLKIFPLSILDHNFRNAYTPLLLFYENKSFQTDNHIHNDDDDTFTSTLAKVRDQRSKILKESLSQLLSIYYPFAGRLMRDNPYSLECNDQGVTFLITHFNHVNLSHILQNPTQDSIIPLFADQLCWNFAVDVVNASFLAIQVNHFACGGIAIAVSMSHKIGDMFTLSNFVKDWGIITQKSILEYSSNTQQAQEEEVLILPKFNGASIFPCGDFPIPKHNDSFRVNEIQRQLKRRFVFESSKIRSLKEMVESQRVHDQQNHHHHHPTRVQVVSALIYKCFVSALRSSSIHHDVNDNNPNINVTTSFRFSVNLRTRVLSLPPPDKSIGNVSLDFLVCTTNEEEGELELHELVRKIPQRLHEIRDTLAKDIERKDMSYFREHIMKFRTSSVITSSENDDDNNNNLVLCNILITSWCRFPMYQIDFGWGKPKWVTTVGHRSRKNVAILMDTRDGEGIEAYVNMEKEAMALFERNEELLRFASLNSSVA